MEATHMYSSLRSACREIWLLRLSPGTWADPLRCTLEVVSLNEQPNYQALSYAWGKSGHAEILQIGEWFREVPTNLCAALRRLRKSHDERIIWADAACINQKDLEERSHQVTLMGDIFSKASEVFVWLGDCISDEDGSLQPSPGTLEDGKGMEWISQNLERIFDNSMFSDHESEALAALGVLFLLSTDCHWAIKPLFAVDGEGRYQVADRYAKAWQAVIKLLHLPWWSRIWVVQELVLAQKATLAVGSVSVSWELISGFYQSYSKHLPPGACCHSSVTWKMASRLWDDIVLMRLTFSTLQSTRDELVQHRNKQADTALWNFLWLLRHKEATDPRDKVYGLLGLLTSQSPPFLVPSYLVSTAEAFSKCMAALIRSSNNLKALVGPRLDEPGLPTWVIDLMPKEHADTVLFSHNIFKRISSSVLFRACGNQALRFSLTSSKLKLHGVPIDAVKDVGAAWKKDSMAHTFEKWQTLGGIADGKQDLLHASQYARYNAFWRTMIRDTIRDYDDGERTRRASPNDEVLYTNFHRWLCEPSDANNEGAMAFRKSFFIATQDQQFFTTRNDCIGLGDRILPGDEIWILFGGSVPFILRPYPDDSEHHGCYALIGDCYVHGIMDGEAMETWEDNDTREALLV